MRSSRKQMIVKLKQRREEIAARAEEADKRVLDRLRPLQARETAAERRRDTRRKIVVGSLVLAARKADTEISLRWLENQIQALERPHDRRLFDLDDAAGDNGDDAAKKTKPAADGDDAAKKTKPAAAGPPITARQKNLLARLVAQQPETARELGIDPEKPGLEKLSKSEATPLIGKALDRLKAEGIRLMNS